MPPPKAARDLRLNRKFERGVPIVSKFMGAAPTKTECFVKATGETAILGSIECAGAIFGGEAGTDSSRRFESRNS